MRAYLLRLTLAAATVALLAGVIVLATPDEAEASCTGIRYDYYATAACKVKVGTERFGCAGDLPAHTIPSFITNYFVSYSVSCPGTCGGGGGSNPDPGFF